MLSVINNNHSLSLIPPPPPFLPLSHTHTDFNTFLTVDLAGETLTTAVETRRQQLIKSTDGIIDKIRSSHVSVRPRLYTPSNPHLYTPSPVIGKKPAPKPPAPVPQEVCVCVCVCVLIACVYSAMLVYIYICSKIIYVALLCVYHLKVLVYTLQLCPYMCIYYI